LTRDELDPDDRRDDLFGRLDIREASTTVEAEVPLFMKKNPYVKAVAPLFNNGKLFALGVHRYWDVDYVPMKDRYDYSLQSQFEQVKRDAGITADIAFYTDEMNFKKRKVTEEEAAAGMLTALWDALGVVGEGGAFDNDFFRAICPGLRHRFAPDFVQFFEELSWNTP